MAAGGKAKAKEEEDGARCRRHPRHRHSAGVCPFCLRDRLSRLSPAAATDSASPASSSSASSACSAGDENAGPAQAPPFRGARRARLGLLMRQEEREAAAAAEAEAPGEKKAATAAAAAAAARRGNFWARLQQQLHHGGWHWKDGCSLAHSRADAEKPAVPPKRAPLC